MNGYRITLPYTLVHKSSSRKDPNLSDTDQERIQSVTRFLFGYRAIAICIQQIINLSFSLKLRFSRKPNYREKFRVTSKWKYARDGNKRKVSPGEYQTSGAFQRFEWLAVIYSCPHNLGVETLDFCCSSKPVASSSKGPFCPKESQGARCRSIRPSQSSVVKAAACVEFDRAIYDVIRRRAHGCDLAKDRGSGGIKGVPINL